MGIVYGCEQRDPVRRTVAVKVVKVGLDTREVIARFNAERQALSLMNHPNVARALDAADRAQAKAYREADKATTVSRFLQNVLAPPERDGDEQVRDARIIDLLARAQRDVAERFKDQPEVQFQTRYTLFRTYSNLGLAQLAKEQLDHAWALLQRHPPLGETETGLRAAADYAYYFPGGPTDRERLAADAARVAQERLGDSSEPAILATYVRARALSARGKSGDANAIYRQLVNRLRAAGPGAIEDAKKGRLRERRRRRHRPVPPRPRPPRP
jgi:hypothetical protein